MKDVRTKQVAASTVLAVDNLQAMSMYKSDVKNPNNPDDLW